MSREKIIILKKIKLSVTSKVKSLIKIIIMLKHKKTNIHKLKLEEMIYKILMMLGKLFLA